MALASILNAAARILILERLMSFPILMLQVSVIWLDVYQLISTVGLETTHICLRKTHTRAEEKNNLAVLPNFL